jgi:glycosyltransferase involved in cell wall biosynthesis
MATEGTYPFSGGGVGTWCHQLCEGLDAYEFSILAITGDTQAVWHYPRAKRVRRVIQVPLWPGEEPALYLRPGRYGDVLRMRLRTTNDEVARGFLPSLRTFLQEVFVGGVPAPALLEAVVDMGSFLRRHDYKETLRAPATWEAFREASDAFCETDLGRSVETPRIAEVTMCARWFYNMMMPLGVDLDGDAALFHATGATPSALPGIVARHIDGLPFLLTEHGVYLRERYIAVSSSFYSPMQKRFLIGVAAAIGRACYATADLITPVAAYNQRWELLWGAPKDRVRVIYNGVDPGLFRPGPKPPSCAGRPTAVAAARVFPLKDIETMIRAVAIARQRLPDLHVNVYGSLAADVPYVEKCRALIEELGVGANFELAGFHAKPAEIFLEGDISLLSSISEGFPYTVLESMSCGVPCVATDVGGVREAIADTGSVVAPRDSAAFADAMVDLLIDNDRRRELARRGRERLVSEFTLSRQLASYEEVYRQLARAAAVTPTRRAAEAPAATETVA